MLNWNWFKGGREHQMIITNNSAQIKMLPAQSQIDRLRTKPDEAVKGPNADNSRDEKLYKACQDFESIFFQMMMKSMRQTVDKTDLTDGGFGEEVFQGMMDEQISTQAAKQSSSIAEILYKQLRLQLDGKPWSISRIRAERV